MKLITRFEVLRFWAVRLKYLFLFSLAHYSNKTPPCDLIGRSKLLELAQRFGLVTPDSFSSCELGGVCARDYLYPCIVLQATAPLVSMHCSTSNSTSCIHALFYKQQHLTAGAKLSLPPTYAILTCQQNTDRKETQDESQLGCLVPGRHQQP